MLTTSDREFQARVERRELPVDCHDHVLRIAFIYMDDGLWDDNGVFGVVEKLHTHGWSFGQGDWKFNRTLDVFFLTQIAAGTYRLEDLTDDSLITSLDDFGVFYTQYHDLLCEGAWKQYYSPAFLAQPTSARFYRLPNLRDLPDAADPLGMPRKRPVGHWTKLPHWANTVVRTHMRQPTLPLTTITQLALETLQQTILRLRKDFPSVAPYSETQARFWLAHPAFIMIWCPQDTGKSIAQGLCDTWAWEAHYSPALWNAADETYHEPDLDGTREGEVRWSGMPDGGLGVYSWLRGWDPEAGSEEEIAFLAAVAVQETEGVDVDSLDYTIQSHMLLGVLRAACAPKTERDRHVEDLKQRIAAAGRLETDRVEPWIRQALRVMEPYGQTQHGWPAGAEERNALLRQILLENGQLFGRWRFSPLFQEFDFKLERRKWKETTNMDRI